MYRYRKYQLSFRKVGSDEVVNMKFKTSPSEGPLRSHILSVLKTWSENPNWCFGVWYWSIEFQKSPTGPDVFSGPKKNPELHSFSVRLERLKLKSWLRKCDKVEDLYWQRLKASCCWRHPGDERWLVATGRLEVRGWVMGLKQQASAKIAGLGPGVVPLHFSWFDRGLWHSSDTMWTGKLTSRSSFCCREDGLPNQSGSGGWGMVWVCDFC